MTNGTNPDDFPDFLQAASECGLPFAPSDMCLAKAMWKILDPDQRKASLEGLYARQQCGEYDEAAYRPLPQNYLGKKLWRRPLRPKHNHVAMTHERVWGKPTPAEPDPEATRLLAWADANGYAVTNGKQLQEAEDAYRRASAER